MRGERWDVLARSLGTIGTRRTVMQAAAVVLTGIVPAGFRQRDARAADSPPPIPPGSLDPWPACSAERPHYCVAAFSVDGVDQLSTEAPGYLPEVRGTRGSVDGGVTADRLEWFSIRTNDVLQLADLDKEFFLRIRTGRLEPVMTSLWAAGVRMRTTGDAAAGWELEVRGRPGLLPSSEDPVPSEQATITFTWFHGMSIHRENPELQGWRFEGYMAASGARGFGGPRWAGDGWRVFLEGHHLLPGGSVNHGSYGAWISPGTVRRLGLTVQQAVTSGLVVTRIDDGVESAVEVEISELDGGVHIDIPDLTFSSPTIVIRRRGKRGCRKRCGKRRKCKNGRCVKKRRKKRK